jgi:hypothetical protein
VLSAFYAKLLTSYRTEAKDPRLWIGAEELVREMPAEVKEPSPDWASDPPDEEALRTSFASSLEQTERALSLLQASGGLSEASTGAVAVGRHSRGQE